MRWIAIIAVLTACSSKGTPAAAPAAPSPPETGEPAAGPAPAPVDDRPLTDDECAQMIGHIVDIGMETQRRTKKSEEVPSAEQVAAIRDQMVRSMTPECLRLERASWHCAMNATSEAALDACTAESAPNTK